MFLKHGLAGMSTNQPLKHNLNKTVLEKFDKKKQQQQNKTKSKPAVHWFCTQ